MAQGEPNKTPSIYLNKVRTLALWKHELVFVRRFSFPSRAREKEHKKCRPNKYLHQYNSQTTLILFAYNFFILLHEGWTRENQKKNSIETICDAQWMAHRSGVGAKNFIGILLFELCIYGITFWFIWNVYRSLFTHSISVFLLYFGYLYLFLP